MNDHLSFEHWQELMAGFVLGDLDPVETAEFHRVLAERPELAAEVAQIQEVLRQVVDEGVGVEPPSHLCWEILYTAEQENRTLDGAKIDQNPLVVKLWYLIAGGIVATAIGTLGWHDYQVQQALERSEKLVAMIQAPNTRIFQFRGMPVAKNASGSMMVNLSDNRAALAIRDLPVKNGKFYRLWAIFNPDRKLRCGNPIPSEKAVIANEFRISPQEFRELYHPQLKGFVVTVEDSPGTTQPSGPVVMSSM